MGKIYGQKTKEVYIDLFLETLQDPKKLPFKIVRNMCPERKKHCRKRHGEIIIKSYNPETKKFRLLYYAIHQTGIKYDYEQSHDTVKKFLLDSIKRNRLKLKLIRQILERGKTFRDNYIGLRFTNTESKIIKQNAKKKNMKVYTYLRFRALSS